MSQVIDFSNYKPKYNSVPLVKASPPIPSSPTNPIQSHNRLEEIYSDKILFSIRDVAGIIGVSYEFVRQAIHRNMVKVVSFGDRKMISRDELGRLITDGINYGA